jgi:Tfp pilus assembly protein PilO
MKKYFSQLRPLERRLVVGVALVLVIFLNWEFIWPHFSDLGNYRVRRDGAADKLKKYQTQVAELPALQAKVKTYESEGEFVAPEDQAIELMRTIQSQAAGCGFGVQNYSRSTMHTNQFFVEQVQSITVLAEEKNLVDFLYKLGSGSSMIRVRDLSLQPDAPRQRLNATIGFVASYQKTSPAAAAKIATAKAK